MALITTLEELRPHLPIAYGSKIELFPGFDAAENDYLVPTLGNTLYQELCAAYDGDSLTADQLALVKKCRAVIAPFAFVSNLPFMQTMLSNTGLIALETENSRKAFKWEYNKAIAALEANGYAAQEALILFLQARKDIYPTWSESSYNAGNNCGLIRNGADLQSVTGLQQPHRCFLMLKPLLDTVVLMQLRDQIGATLYQAFNGRLLAGTATADDIKLAEYLRPMLARRVMEYAAVELSIQFNGSSFTIIDGTNARDTQDEGRASASDTLLQRFREQMQQTANFFLEAAIRHLNEVASPSIFPEYFTSDLYVSPTTAPRDRNSGRKGIFVLP